MLFTHDYYCNGFGICWWTHDYWRNVPGARFEIGKACSRHVPISTSAYLKTCSRACFYFNLCLPQSVFQARSLCETLAMLALAWICFLQIQKDTNWTDWCTIPVRNLNKICFCLTMFLPNSKKWKPNDLLLGIQINGLRAQPGRACASGTFSHRYPARPACSRSFLWQCLQ